MNNTITLIKIFFKSGSGEISKKKKVTIALFAFILFFSFLPIAIGIGFFFSEAYDIMKLINQEAVLTALALAVSAIVIFFFGIFYVLNSFYFSSDVEYLLPLPLRPTEILTSKFIQVAVYEYLTELVVLLPVFISFGIKSSAGLPFYIYALIIFLTLPVIPLVFASLIIMILMRFSGLFKNKDRFRMISGIIAVFIGAGLNAFFQRFNQDTLNPEKIYNIADSSFTSIASKIFPGIRWGADALAHSSELSGLISMAVFLVISVAAFAIFILAGNALYFKGVLNLSGNTAKRKKMTGRDLSKNVAKSSVMKAYIVKELKLLIRTPVYFINCILMNFIWPLMLLVVMLAESNFTKTLDEARKFISGSQNYGLIAAIGFTFIMFLVSSNGVTSTAISREGQNLFVCKYLPVRYKDQILAKVFSGVAVSMIGLLMVVIVAIAVLRVPPVIILVTVVAGLLGALFNAITGIMMDLANPKLNWDNEQRAVKQNFNLLYNMLLGSAFGGIALLAQIYFNLKFGVFSASVIVILLLLDAVLYRIILVKGVRMFEKLEN